VFQPILSNSKHIDKSADYCYLHPWLGSGLLTSAGEIIFLNRFIYSIALRTIQLTLWGLVEMTKKCCEIALTPSVLETYFDINVSLLVDITCTLLFFLFPFVEVNTGCSIGAGMSPLRLAFAPRKIHARFLVDKINLRVFF